MLVDREVETLSTLDNLMNTIMDAEAKNYVSRDEAAEHVAMYAEAAKQIVSEAFDFSVLEEEADDTKVSEPKQTEGPGE